MIDNRMGDPFKFGLGGETIAATDGLTACGRCGALVPSNRGPCPSIADCFDMRRKPEDAE